MADYSIWMLEYAQCPTQPIGSLIYGQYNAGTRLLSFSYLVMKSDKNIAMVDVGYNYAEYGRDLADYFGVVNWQSPEHVLAKIGLRPEDIDTIFLTHAHYDHMGNLMAFPNAHYYLQKNEVNEWIWAFSLPKQFKFLTLATDPQDILNAVQLTTRGKMTLVDGVVEDVIPGVDLIPYFDSHTFGSQIVTIENVGPENDPDRWVVAGDIAYAFENIEGINGNGEYLPVGFGVGSQVNMMLAIDNMVKLAGERFDRIIVGHEPKSFERYPSWRTSDGLSVAELRLAKGQKSYIP